MIRAFNLCASDFKRYIATGARNKPKIILTNQGFHTTVHFRVATELYRIGSKYLLLRPFVAIYAVFYLKTSQIMTGISLPVGLSVGRGLMISHPGSIIVHPLAKLGSNINLGPGIVIGYGVVNGVGGYPVLGDDIFIGPGAKIFGPIHIGDNVQVGANAVIIRDVEANCKAVGVPAKVIPYNGYNSMVKK